MDKENSFSQMKIDIKVIIKMEILKVLENMYGKMVSFIKEYLKKDFVKAKEW